MEVVFNETYLQEMYRTGQTDKKHRYQPQIIRKYIRVIDTMIDTPDVQGLLRYRSLKRPLPQYATSQIYQTIINNIRLCARYKE